MPNIKMASSSDGKELMRISIGSIMFVAFFLPLNCFASQKSVPNAPFSLLLDSSVIIPFYATDSQLSKSGYEKISDSMAKEYSKDDMSEPEKISKFPQGDGFINDYFIKRIKFCENTRSVYLIYMKVRLKAPPRKVICREIRYTYVLYVLDFQNNKGFNTFCELNKAVYDKETDMWRIDHLRLRRLSNNKKQLSPLFVKLLPNDIRNKIMKSKYVCTLF